MQRTVMRFFSWLAGRPSGFVVSATLLGAVVGATGLARYGDMGSPTGSHVGDAIFFGVFMALAGCVIWFVSARD
jgi:hypothetical protein